MYSILPNANMRPEHQPIHGLSLRAATDMLNDLGGSDKGWRLFLPDKQFVVFWNHNSDQYEYDESHSFEIHWSKKEGYHKEFHERLYIREQYAIQHAFNLNQNKHRPYLGPIPSTFKVVYGDKFQLILQEGEITYAEVLEVQEDTAMLDDDIIVLLDSEALTEFRLTRKELSEKSEK